MNKTDINELIDRSIEIYLERNPIIIDTMDYRELENVLQDLEIPLSPNSSFHSLGGRGIVSRKKFIKKYEDIKTFFETEKERCKYLLIKSVQHYKSPYWVGDGETSYTEPVIVLEYFAAN